IEMNYYPNPFNPTTTIAFSIPKDAKTKLSVYSIKGQKVKDIISGELQKGFHKAVWDGKDSTNRSVSSGIYIFRLESGGKVSVRKAMLMK
ncbi:MAG: T9SS type A sorting domain-containing protein, partial [Candidatus Cloacimonetes bacterium]|nr:T9SS type A sorting domain-containing protein [Candidatus Cloacimonadota bacterium]